MLLAHLPRRIGSTGCAALLALAPLVLPSCQSYFPDDPIIVREEVVGLRPEYLDPALARTLTVAPGELDNRGRSLRLDSFIVQITPLQGLTIYPLAPGGRGGAIGPGGSLLVPGITRILDSRANTVSFDSYGDSVTVAFAAVDSFTLVSRARDVLVVDPYALLRHPSRFPMPAGVESTYDGRVYLECYDPERGVVATWTATELRRPQCLL